MNRISGLNDSVLSREAISQEEGDLSRMNEISAKFRINERTFFFFNFYDSFEIRIDFFFYYNLYIYIYI